MKGGSRVNLFNQAMAGAVALAVVSVTVGMALQHAAYILQYGSIFEPLRSWLRNYPSCKRHPVICRWFCGRFHEAVMCQLCCITQLTLWFWALPATVSVAVVVHKAFPAWPLHLIVPGAILTGTMVWLAQAAVGLACWDCMRLVGRGTEAIIQYLRATKPVAAEGRFRNVA